MRMALASSRLPAALIFFLAHCGSGEARFDGSFLVSSDNKCFRFATLVREPDSSPQQCQQMGTTYCAPDTAHARATRLTLSTENLTQPPAFELLLVNQCKGEPASVQRFGFTVQLFHPSSPFAIGRHFCPGSDCLFSDDSCCVLNLCDGMFGTPGQCITPCESTTVTLHWNVSWQHTEGGNIFTQLHGST